MILIYDNLGKILSSVDSQDVVFLQELKEKEQKAGNNVFEIDYYIDINDYYIDNNLIKIPSKPNNYSEFDYTSKTWVASEDVLKTIITNERFIKLQESDWTDTVTAQTRLTNWQQWQDYRQALRDITQQDGFPLDIEWPVAPT